MVENLEEAIITKNSYGIGFCNKLGFKILRDIPTGKDNKATELNDIPSNEQENIFASDLSNLPKSK